MPSNNIMAEDAPLVGDRQDKHRDHRTTADGMNEKKKDLKGGTKFDGWKRFETIFYIVAIFPIVITAFYDPLERLNKVISSIGSVGWSIYFIFYVMDELFKVWYRQ